MATKGVCSVMRAPPVSPTSITYPSVQVTERLARNNARGIVKVDTTMPPFLRDNLPPISHRRKRGRPKLTSNTSPAVAEWPDTALLSPSKEPNATADILKGSPITAEQNPAVYGWVGTRTTVSNNSTERSCKGAERSRGRGFQNNSRSVSGRTYDEDLGDNDTNNNARPILLPLRARKNPMDVSTTTTWSKNSRRQRQRGGEAITARDGIVAGGDAKAAAAAAVAVVETGRQHPRRVTTSASLSTLMLRETEQDQTGQEHGIRGQGQDDELDK